MRITEKLQKALEETNLDKKEDLIKECAGEISRVLARIHAAQTQLKEAEATLVEEFKGFRTTIQEVDGSVEMLDHVSSRMLGHADLVARIKGLVSQNAAQSESIINQNMPTVNTNLQKLLEAFGNCEHLLELEDRDLASEVKGALAILRALKGARHEVSAAEK